jgi:hypothetical protein
LSKSSNSPIADTSLGEPKPFQDEEEKIIAEDHSSTVHRKIPFKIDSSMTIIWKGVEEGRRGSIISFQSKETILGVGGSVFEEIGMPPCSEGTELKMKKTYLKNVSLLERRVGSF